MDDGLEFILFIIVMVLLFICLAHDLTVEARDQKLAQVLVEHNVPLDKIKANSTLFENYKGLEEAYLKIQYKRLMASESRPNLEK